MSELNPMLHRRAQLAAIARLRWRLFVNSLRSTGGKLELVSQIMVSLAFAIGGLGGAFGMAVAAYLASRPASRNCSRCFCGSCSSSGKSFLSWRRPSPTIRTPPVCCVFRSATDSYFLVRLAYGAFDPATALGSLWSFGILLGVGFSKPDCCLGDLVVLLVFAAFNLLLMQMTLAWVDAGWRNAVPARSWAFCLFC